VVTTSGGTEDELRLWLKERVVGYEIPREIRMVQLLPYTAIGKPHNRTMQEMAGS